MSNKTKNKLKTQMTMAPTEDGTVRISFSEPVDHIDLDIVSANMVIADLQTQVMSAYTTLLVKEVSLQLLFTLLAENKKIKAFLDDEPGLSQPKKKTTVH